MQDSDHPGLCFGFSIDEVANSDEIDVNLVFSG